MSKLLDKYNLKLNTTKTSYGWLSITANTNKAGRILSELFISNASIFGIKELIRKFVLVKYEIDVSFSFYTEYEGGILVKNQNVYITNFHDDNEEWRIRDAYDSISINEFEELLLCIYKMAKNTMSENEKLLERLKYRIDEIYQQNGIGEIGNIHFENNNIQCIFDCYKCEIRVVNNSQIQYSISDMRKRERNEMNIISETNLKKTLHKFFNTARPNRTWS